MGDGRVHVVELQLVGHLTGASLGRELGALSARLDAELRYGLLVECSAMTDYELDARGVFTAWLATHRALLMRIAVVTDKRLWHLVVSAMALASRTPMRAFSDHREALRYLADGAPRASRSA
jgi:hypothetical protein